MLLRSAWSRYGSDENICVYVLPAGSTTRSLLILPASVGLLSGDSGVLAHPEGVLGARDPGMAGCPVQDGSLPGALSCRMGSGHL